MFYYLLPQENGGYTKFGPLLSVGTLPIWYFIGMSIVNFIPAWKSEIVNQSDLQTNSSEN